MNKKSELIAAAAAEPRKDFQPARPPATDAERVAVDRMVAVMARDREHDPERERIKREILTIVEMARKFEADREQALKELEATAEAFDVELDRLNDQLDNVVGAKEEIEALTTQYPDLFEETPAADAGPK